MSKSFARFTIFLASVAFLFGCSSSSGSDLAVPSVVQTTPLDGSLNVVLNRTVTANFDVSMDPATINSETFILTGPGGARIPAAVTAVGSLAVLTPSANLATNTLFNATITTGAKDLAGTELDKAYEWSFTTGTIVSMGPPPISLGKAGDFVILAKSGIDTVPTSAISGDIGVSPAAATYVTGFNLFAHSSNAYSTSTQVVGKVYAANYASPTPADLTAAVGNMQTAYVDAAGRTLPDHINLGAGNISGMTLSPGLYKWGTGLLISSDVTLSGGPNDVWIFQISGDLTVANGKKVILAGGALPKNVFWQTFGVASIGTTAHMEGVILAKTAITLDTGASINGRLYAQTAVTLKSSTVTQP